MKLSLVLSAVAAIAVAFVSAEETTDLRIASPNTLNNPTALVNKNTLATDNNVFIARSNVIFQQSDRLAMRQRVRDALTRGEKETLATAVLTKSVLRAVSAPTTDAALMTKASAVVAMAQGDASMLTQRIADFVDAVGKREIDQEQAIQSQTPRGVIVLVGTKDILRQPTAAVNKNVAMSDNQVAVSRSRIEPQQNDQIVLAGGAKVADMVAPASAITTNQRSDSEPMYRVAIVYPKDREADDAMEQLQQEDHQEQWGLWGPGWGLGWRYPLGYWNRFGAGLYGGACGLGFARGPFFYC